MPDSIKNFDSGSDFSNSRIRYDDNKACKNIMFYLLSSRCSNHAKGYHVLYPRKYRYICLPVLPVIDQLFDLLL